LDCSGKADAFYTGRDSDEVWGVIVDVPDEQREALDKAEGLGNGYDDRRVTVYDVGEMPHDVIAYVAEDSAIDPHLRPYDWYKALVVNGARAHGLPAWYVAHVVGVEEIVDTKESRPGRPKKTEDC
jgi:hypothetical protein